MGNAAFFRCGLVAVVGRPNVGKSTLMNHLIGQKISITSRKAQTTRQRVTGILTDAEAQFVFVDTPGFQTRHLNTMNRMMNRSVKQSLNEVDCVYFVIEGTRFDARDAEVVPLLPKGRPVILVINKIDHLEALNTLLPFIEKMQTVFPFVSIVPVSAKRNTQLDRLLSETKKYLPVASPMFDADDLTDRDERFLAAEFLREKIFRLLGDELPYTTSVVIEKFETEGNLRRIFAAVLVDRESHRAMILGEGGLKMKEIASAARKDMENLFGGKVWLEVFIRVRSGWADDESALRKLGFS